jgi:hypothetical protein
MGQGKDGVWKEGSTNVSTKARSTKAKLLGLYRHAADANRDSAEFFGELMRPWSSVVPARAKLD